ncbi:MAG: Lrp/AsnC family transcriptional regulator [Planktomarina sp.]
MAKIDQIDEKILRELQRDGRVSNLDLADRAGLSPSACLRRVQALERDGVIQGYRAVINPEKTGRGFVAIVAVGLSDHSKKSQDGFELAMSTATQVTEVHNVSGTVEYFLRVEVADLPAYKYFHTEILGTQTQVNEITTYIVMGSPKDERA